MKKENPEGSLGRILVTGASGFLGGWICKIGQERNMTVGGTYYSRSFEMGGTWKTQVDLKEERDIRETISSFSPDVVIHCAAIASVERCEEDPELSRQVNVEGSKRVAKFAAKESSHLVLMSTNFVFGEGNSPYTEKDKPSPMQVYGRTKLKAERAVQHNHPSPLIVRTSDLYGPILESSSTRENMILWLLEKLHVGEPVSLVNNVYMSPTYVSSIAEEIFNLLEHEATGIYHRSGIGCYNRFEVGLRVADIFGLRTNLIKECSSEGIWDAPRPTRSCLKSVKPGARKAKTSETLESGLRKMRKQIEKE